MAFTAIFRMPVGLKPAGSFNYDSVHCSARICRTTPFQSGRKCSRPRSVLVKAAADVDVLIVGGGEHLSGAEIEYVGFAIG